MSEEAHDDGAQCASVADARTLALRAGREFRDALRAYGLAVGADERRPQAEKDAELRFARDLTEEVQDVLERLVARLERMGDRR